MTIYLRGDTATIRKKPDFPNASVSQQFGLGWEKLNMTLRHITCETSPLKIRDYNLNYRTNNFPVLLISEKKKKKENKKT